MLLMAPYARQSTGTFIGQILQRIYRALGKSAKEAAGNRDKAQWSRMIHGQGAMDLNVLFDELDLETFSKFLGSVLAAKVQRHQEAQKQKECA